MAKSLQSLDDALMLTVAGSPARSLTKNLYGINISQAPGLLPTNKDLQGYTFFVRPQLNLQDANVRNVRQFSSLLSTDPISSRRFVRCCLDPRLVHGYGKVTPMGVTLLNNRQAFISPATNNIKSISGWPDITAQMFISKKGLYGEEWGCVDSTTLNYESGELDVTFRNVTGDVLHYLFHIWVNYTSFVFDGRMTPYIDFVTENEIDYNTRIYRLVMDKNKEKVVHIGATGAAVPITDPMGRLFDFSEESPYSDQGSEFSIRFKTFGHIYDDNTLIHDFNKTVEIFNPDMADPNREGDPKNPGTSRKMVKVPRSLISLFESYAYPRINPQTAELEWWTEADLYMKRTSIWLRANSVNSEEYEGD